MSNKRVSQKGFTLLEGIIIITVIGIIGLICVLIWYNISSSKKDTQTNTTPTQQSSNTESQEEQQSDLLASYTSVVGGFSIKYPKAWIVTGTQNGQTSNTLTGNETQLHFQVAPSTSTINNYGADLFIRDVKPQDAAWPLYPNGSIVAEYDNGISAWEDNQTQTFARGSVKNTCPTIRIAADDSFGFALKTGKYLEFNGGFCWATGMKTTYSYQQQRTSTEFTQTLDMLKSIKQP